ncbi:hypothetical protein [Mycoplasmopsis felis]|nr:hypothetical protein [Mycoplasmopsis felis]UWV83988.1 hypothetical protein NWE58_00335 [Mycoplasmopsis felis]
MFFVHFNFLGFFPADLESILTKAPKPTFVSSPSQLKGAKEIA